VKWYGSFNILDQYIPEQHRLFYTQNEDDPNGPYIALLGAGASQKSGSLYYSWLNDNIYNAGTDISKSFNWLNGKQAIKAGYLFQVKTGYLIAVHSSTTLSATRNVSCHQTRSSHQKTWV
jgi:hypothetical protein